MGAGALFPWWAQSKVLQWFESFLFLVTKPPLVLYRPLLPDATYWTINFPPILALFNGWSAQVLTRWRFSLISPQAGRFSLDSVFWGSTATVGLALHCSLGNDLEFVSTSKFQSIPAPPLGSTSLPANGITLPDFYKATLEALWFP